MEAGVSIPPNDDLEYDKAQLVADLEALERAKARLSKSGNPISKFALSLLVRYRQGNVDDGQRNVEKQEKASFLA